MAAHWLVLEQRTCAFAIPSCKCCATTAAKSVLTANVTFDSVFGAWASSAPMMAVPSLYAYYWPIARS